MIYNRTTWENSPSTSTPINAQNLNKIEQGITDAANEINAISHIANVGTEVEEDYRLNVIHSRNIIDSYNFQSGAISGSTGQMVEYGTRVCTINKIPVEPSTKYAITMNTTTSYSFLMIIDAYSKDGTYLGRISANNGYTSGTYVQTQATAKYINITMRDTTDSQVSSSSFLQYLSNGSLQIQLVKGETSLAYEPYIQNQLVVDNEKFTDTINVGTNVDDKSRVNVLKSKNLLDLSLLGMIVNQSGTVIANSVYWDAIIDTRKISSLYVSGNFSLLADNTIRVGTYSTYPVLGSTGRRLTLQASGTIDTSNVNYVLFAFGMSSSSVTIDQVKASFMINEGTEALPYEPYTTNSINVDGETFTDTIKVSNEVDGKSRVNFIKSKNLFNKNTALLNTGINGNTGALTTNNNSFISDFIKVEKNTDYYISGGLTSVYGYSSNFTFLSTIVDVSGEKTFNSGNAEYVRVKNWYASDTSAMQSQLNTSMMNIGTSALPYEPYIQNQIVVDNETFTDTLKVGTNVDSKSRVNVLKSRNIVQTSNIYMQQGLKSEDGTMASVASRVTIYKVPIKPNTQYTLSCASGYQIGNVFQYNSSGTYTSTAESSFATSKQYTSTSTTYYISFVLKNDANTTIDPSEINNIKVQIEEGSTATTYEPYNIPNQIVVDNETFTDTLKVGTNVDSRSRVNVLKSTNLFDLDYYYNNCNTNNCTKEKTTTGIKLSFTAGLDAFVGWAGKSGFTLPDEAKRILIPVKPNTNYTISLSTSTRNSTYITYVTSDYSVINSSYQPISDKYTWTFTTPVNCKYIVLRFGVRDNSITTYTFADIRLNEGTEALPYEPYIVPSINVDGEEIYKYNVLQNGKGTWTHSSINYGSVFYHTIGNLVILNISDLQVSSNITSLSTRTKIASGLPRNGSPLATGEFGILNNFNNGSTAYTVRVIVDESGDLYLNYSNLNTSQRYYGVIVYTTTD